MTREGWSTAEEKAHQQLLQRSELEGSVSGLVAKAKSTKEKEMREKVLPKEISQALVDFKADKMAVK